MNNMPAKQKICIQ